MKKLLSLITAILIAACSLSISAEIISSRIAQEAANNFLALDNEWHGATDANVKLVEHEGIPAYYIVQYTAGGWAIVSAQSSSMPVIGYNTTGVFEAPAPVKKLLDFNARIITARAKDMGKIEHVGWQRVKQRKAATESIINSTPDIAPLIKIDLNQSAPFNTYCPKIDGKNSLAGCVAVGMTQAMMVQGYPPRATGSHSYTSATTGIHSINYDNEKAYNWDAIYASEQTGNYDEIARLLYHAGVSVDMQYGLEGSGAQTALVADALVRNFGYSNKIVKFMTKTPNDNEWLDLLLNELSHGRAVVYSGQALEGGHCWNIDGWKQSTQMLHCNWGWAGYGNGYFSLNNMTDSYQSINFLYDHGAVFGVQAPTEAPFDILLKSQNFVLGTTAGATLTHIEVLSTDNNASYRYELYGPNNTISPYQVNGNKLVSSETIAASDNFKYLRIKATNTASGESYEKIFDINIVSANTLNLLGTYDVHANSAFTGYPDSEWQIEIVADKYDNTKVWLQPICQINGLQDTEIYRVYATYNETKNTLTMPMGQVLFETPNYKLICGTSNGSNIDITNDITLEVAQSQSSTQITFAKDYVFGVGDILHENGWWYQALKNITLTKASSKATAPLGIELSTTSIALGTASNVALADVTVLCDSDDETFRFDVYGPQGATSPYKIVGNKLMSNQTIANSDEFKFVRIKATNTITGESCEAEFTLNIVETIAIEKILGEYNAFAHSAFKDYPDEEWSVSITADGNNPNIVWIKPICLFAGLNETNINPVYAIYNALESTLLLPLGQVLYEQGDNYRMIVGASTDAGNTKLTSGNLVLNITYTDERAVITFDPSTVVGVGNAIDNAWWYQALHGIVFTQSAPYTYDPIDIDELAGKYYAFAHSAFNGYPDEEWDVTLSIDMNTPNKVWIKPIFLFANLDPKYINAVYATYDASKGTLTMPLGQVLYEQDDKYRIITGASFDNGQSRDTSGIITFIATKEDENIVIKLNENAVLGTGNAVTDQWWWQALYDMTYTKVRVYEKIEIDGIYYNITSNIHKTAQVSFKGNSYDQYSNEYSDAVVIPETITYDGTTFTVTSIEESTFYFCTKLTSITIPGSITEIGEKAFYNCINLAEINIGAINPPLIYAETFMGVDKSIPVYVPDNSKPYYVSSQYWNEFTNIVDNACAECIGIDDIIGNYNAFAHSAFKDSPDEEWSVNITADTTNPSMVWIHPICLFSNLSATHITPVYATLNAVDSTLVVPLGQVLYEQADKYKMIVGASTDYGETILTSGNLVLKITFANDRAVITFDPSTLVGVGNAIDNAWWYQALYGITFTEAETTESGKIEIDGIYYNITSANTAEVTYKGNSYDEYNNEYSGTVIIPETINYNGATYTVTAIGDKTFIGCNDLTLVIIGNNVSSIGEYAFYGCSNLTNITWPSSALTIKNQAFMCSGVRNVTIRANMQLGYAVFYECASLTSVTIEEGVTVIPEWTFGYCNGITQINLPNTVEKIENYALYNCSSLASITIPASVVSIGQSAIGQCGSLESIVVEPENGVYDSRENCNALIETATNTLLKGCNNTVIPQDIVTIGREAFAQCYKLTIIVIPKGVTTIDAWAFFNCTALSSASIPSSVTEIGEAAFYNCTGMTELCVFATNPPTIYEETFGNVDKSIPVYVPDGCIEVYRVADYWREFTTFNVYSGIESAIADSNIEVITTNGTIAINGVFHNAVVNIYSIQGMLMHTTTAGNIGNITLPRGMYIVQVESTTHKIVL